MSPKNESRLMLHFSDGSTHETDLVVGADGIRSSIRSAVTGQPSNANLAFSNTIAYRTLVPWNELKKQGMKTDLTLGMTCFAGKGKVSGCSLSLSKQTTDPWCQSMSSYIRFKGDKL